MNTSITMSTIMTMVRIVPAAVMIMSTIMTMARIVPAAAMIMDTITITMIITQTKYLQAGEKRLFRNIIKKS